MCEHGMCWAFVIYLGIVKGKGKKRENSDRERDQCVRLAALGVTRTTAQPHTGRRTVVSYRPR